MVALGIGNFIIEQEVTLLYIVQSEGLFNSGSTGDVEQEVTLLYIIQSEGLLNSGSTGDVEQEVLYYTLYNLKVY